MTINREILFRAVDVPFHRAFRRYGRPITVPIEIRFAVTYRCLNQCLTCRVTPQSQARELEVEEYASIFKGMGFSPFSLTFTGGEPFVREDFQEIISMACRDLSPALVVVESCGDHPDNIGHAMKEIAEAHPNIQFVLRLSMDGSYQQLDYMRGGVTHSFESFLKTYQTMKTLAIPNVLIGINILISKFNEDMGPRLIEDAFMLYPDLVSLDFAFGSEVFGVTALEVSPENEKAAAIAVQYLEKLREMRGRGAVRILNRLPAESVRMAERNLRKMTRTRPCYAGFSSIYIDPAGSVRDCPVAAREMGDLRENAYNLSRILESHPAVMVRDQVKNSDCFCTMSAPAFSNILMSPIGYLKLIAAAI